MGQTTRPMGQTTRPLGEIYAENRIRVGKLVLGLSDAQLATMLPTCPEWNVRDVVGHMVGLLDDVLVKRFEGAGTPEWTAAQVAATRDLELAAAIELWDERAQPVEADFEAVAEVFAPRLVSDIWNHEQDIRGALHLPAAHRDSDAIAPALAGHMDPLGGRVEVASPAELLRVFLGRRSRAQVAALDWDVPDRAAYVAAFPRFGPAEHDIHE